MVLTIGADPELLIVNGEDSVMEASEYISEASSDESEMVGCDGDETLGEIRPKYSRNAIDLAKNVKRCLKVLYGERLIEDAMPCKGLGGSGRQGAVTGGHIHFGIPEERRLVSALNAVSLLILKIEDSPQNTYRRNCSSYGALSDIRTQEWGFEYRTPSSWLISPEITEGVLCLYHAVAMAYKNKINKPERLIAIGDAISDSDKTEFKKANVGHFNDRIVEVASLVRKLPAYRSNAVYREKIDVILKMAENGKHWREERDIFSTWNVKNSRNCFIRYSGDLFMEHYDDINAPRQPSKSLYVYGRMRNNYDTTGYMRVYSDSDVVVKAAKEYLQKQKVEKILVRKEERLTGRDCTELGIGHELRKKTELCRGLIEAVRDSMLNMKGGE